MSSMAKRMLDAEELLPLRTCTHKGCPRGWKVSTTRHCFKYQNLCLNCAAVWKIEMAKKNGSSLGSNVSRSFIIINFWGFFFNLRKIDLSIYSNFKLFQLFNRNCIFSFFIAGENYADKPLYRHPKPETGPHWCETYNCQTKLQRSEHQRLLDRGKTCDLL